MKKIITAFLPIVVAAAMLIAMIPALSVRVSNEKANDNIIVSLLYNNLRNTVSPQMLDEMLDEYLEAGIDTVSVMEEDINSLVARGEVTSIKFNVLLHKYDQESLDIASVISENHPDVSYDSHIVLVKKPEARAFLERFIPEKYTSEDYVKIEGVEGIDLYAFYDGREKLWDLSLAYDETVIKNLRDRGFKVALVHTLRNNNNTEYTDYIDYLVKEYDIEFFNIKKSAEELKPEDEIKENYKKISDIVTENGMTLVVTENTDQLSNQKFMGYDEVVSSVLENGSKKILRSYETYDDSHDDGSHHIYRTNQYYNSTIDRNMRFITVTQITSAGITYDECAQFTLTATKNYIDRVRAQGFTVNEETEPYSYPVSSRFPNACSAVAAIMLLVVAVGLVFDYKKLWLTLASVVFSALVFVGTYVVPASLVSLYPSLYCVAVSCFAMTVALKLTKLLRDKNTFVALIAVVASVLAVLCVGVLGMGAQLSGIDYYLNNSIFRGIKLSLIVPILYTVVIYYFMYIRNENTDFLKDVTAILKADIKVYWVIIAGAVGIVGGYYLMRSGNVNQISSVEQTMRNLITEYFPARPRTKEFLVGYPALVLFVWYVKNTNSRLMQWGFAALSAILAASVTNSFCHVFTDLSTIYMRVVNGLIIGIVISVVAYVVNCVAVKLVKRVYSRINK